MLLPGQISSKEVASSKLLRKTFMSGLAGLLTLATVAPALANPIAPTIPPTNSSAVAFNAVNQITPGASLPTEQNISATLQATQAREQAIRQQLINLISRQNANNPEQLVYSESLFNAYKSAKEYADQIPGATIATIKATRSMYPELDWDSLVVIVPTNYEDLKPTDIVGKRDADGTSVLHRIRSEYKDKRHGKIFVTKGDKLPKSDASPLTPNNYIGQAGAVFYFDRGHQERPSYNNPGNLVGQTTNFQSHLNSLATPKRTVEGKIYVSPQQYAQLKFQKHRQGTIAQQSSGISID